ncbi:MAG: Holliday junction branch migration protein RuvA [Dehalococcoidia bacterium]|nr:Holliday junction branch migration protein RuvA [Dehalococcoidia bacterium]MSQ16293.1 Holliday junction branch migration protein RuvA [Dehalococcoidia bacterium]
MIVSLRGVLEAAGTDWVHLQVGGGVTLRVSVASNCIAGLGAIGSPVRLFTHLRFTDEQPVLYGFPTSAARDVFLTLLTVSGVGPRMALSLVSTLGVDGLQQAIEAGDVTALSAARGVGRRTAGRVILELKGKLELDTGAAASATGAGDGEVVDALTALGYSAAEVRRALAGLERAPGQSLEDRIRLALGRLGGG